MRLILNLVALSLLVGSFQSCVSQKKYNELLSAKEATDQALAETQAQVQSLQDENEELQATLEEERERLNGELEELRSDLNNTKDQVAEVQEKLNMTEEQLNSLKEQINGAFNAYSESGLTLEEREGRLYVVTKENIQYSIGSARLSSSERGALDELANVMKENPELRILVEGHTDNLQYPAGAGFNNWDLSVSRAMGVVKYLLRQGVNADQLAVSGYGETMPAASNDSADGRSQNRRTVVRPDVDLGPVMKEAMNQN
jgi:chemotaxis protein MotB